MVREPPRQHPQVAALRLTNRLIGTASAPRRTRAGSPPRAAPGPGRGQGLL